jgi:hypothetical protein
MYLMMKQQVRNLMLLKAKCFKAMGLQYIFVCCGFLFSMQVISNESPVLKAQSPLIFTDERTLLGSYKVLSLNDQQLKLLDLLGVASFIGIDSEQEKQLLSNLSQTLSPELLAQALSALSTPIFTYMLEKEHKAAGEQSEQQAYQEKLTQQKVSPVRLQLMKDLLNANQVIPLLKASGHRDADESLLIGFYLYSYRYTLNTSISAYIKVFEDSAVKQVIERIKQSLILIKGSGE